MARLPRIASSTLAAILLAACASVTPIPDRPLLKRLQIEGAKAIPASEIREKILTAGTSWVPFSEKRAFDESLLDTDVKRIVRLYQARGYFRARVTERLITPRGEAAVDVTLRIDEGPPTLVADLFIEGLDDLPGAERAAIAGSLPLKEGAVFDEDRYEALKADLLTRLKNRGFAEAEVHGVANVDLPRNEVSVVVGVETGPRYAVDKVFVAGARRVDRTRIVRLAQRAVTPGATYDESRLGEAQQKVFDLGVFAGVKVTRGAPDRQEKTVPVVVNVREAPFITWRAGAGVGIDRSRFELPRGLVELTHRNFLGDLRKLTLALKPSFVLLSVPDAFRGDRPDLRGVAGTASADFEQPELFAETLVGTLGLEYERGVETSFRFHAGKARAGVVWRPGAGLTVTPSYNLALVLLDLPPAARSEALRVPGQDQFLDDCALTGRTCALSYLEQRVALDRRDNAIDPSRGVYASLALQEGFSAVGSDYDTVRIAPEVRGFVPVGPHVLAARLEAGALLPFGGSKRTSILSRFFLGGSSSQRGFASRELGPRLLVPSATKPGEVDALPYGGNGMLLAGLEARFRLPASFGLVLFADAGEVTSLASGLSASRLHVATGLGLRYRTLFGPVRFDVAWRANKATFDPAHPDPEVVQGDSASPLTPPAVPRFNFFLSIGEAF